ncbi:MAG: UDP-N-acetylmuramoyl-L-alanyl-D-glutamate--2,6-diaminopimelate ligase [Vallitaleaceae bacterium]|nr:UDP-N-acetylmuramoyl-L-alanyl-D-glutamate--2,6-diaminopimelate ligase [Vallitaleaceae bacterium]
MKLIGLLQGLEYIFIKGSIDVNIKSIANDSRQVSEGGLFICIDGFEVDGHKFIKNAIEMGAKAILVQKEVEVEESITIVQVEDTRVAMAHIASVYYNQPSSNFDLVGITGTNGKTSTVFLIKSILESYGKKTGIIGTIENRIGDVVIEASRTTPEAIELQGLFSKMVDANVNAVLMEVSSHALDLHRVDQCQFDIGLFTNLTLDHLDYHKTMENYRDAKLKLFTMCKTGIVNIDDEVGPYMIAKGTCEEFITLGCNNNKASLNAIKLNSKITGTDFCAIIDGQEHFFQIQTPGKFSVYNALSAIAVCLKLGVPVEVIKNTLKTKSQVKGRFETLMGKNGVYAIVDYAHSPDGLENVLSTLTEVATAKIITVFGCGGNRDKSKRPQMGKIAGLHSDYVIITSDNPRKEEPQVIIDEIEVGVLEAKCPYEKITDRELAIHKALSMAKSGDIVLIAGKGHEDYQIIGDQVTHFDDAEKVTKWFNPSI